VADFHVKVLGLDYCGQFDDLLFLFKFMFEKIHQTYSRAEKPE
jgi:hypothetical protein